MPSGGASMIVGAGGGAVAAAAVAGHDDFSSQAGSIHWERASGRGFPLDFRFRNAAERDRSVEEAFR